MSPGRTRLLVGLVFALSCSPTRVGAQSLGEADLSGQYSFSVSRTLDGHGGVPGTLAELVNAAWSSQGNLWFDGQGGVHGEELLNVPACNPGSLNERVAERQTRFKLLGSYSVDESGFGRLTLHRDTLTICGPVLTSSGQTRWLDAMPMVIDFVFRPGHLSATRVVQDLTLFLDDPAQGLNTVDMTLLNYFVAEGLPRALPAPEVRARRRSHAGR